MTQNSNATHATAKAPSSGVEAQPLRAPASLIADDALWARVEQDKDRVFRALDPRRRGLSVFGDFSELSSESSGGHTGSWSSERNADVQGLRVGGHDVLASFDPVAGQKTWFLWAVHTDGDSFGEEGGLFCPIAVFQTERAGRLAQATLKLHSQWSSGHQIYPRDSERVGIFDDEGRSMFVDAPWNGAFSRLQALELRPFILLAP